jgi:hypothetical protein
LVKERYRKEPTMNRTEAIRFVLGLCSHLRRSQAKTLSQVVPAAMETERLCLAEMGRRLSKQTGVWAKHCIKRVDRLIGNVRIEPLEAMRGVVQWLAQPRKRLLVSLDWVQVRSFACLVLAGRLRGRALPLLWTVCRDADLHRSRNSLEYGLLRLLRTMVPPSTHVVILGDRGFGRTEMARACQELRFGYILRIQPTVYVKHPDFAGKLLDLPVRPGSRRMLRHAQYRKVRPVQQHVAVVWEPGQKEPWFLVTNLPRLGSIRLSRIFGRRMTIEQYFRDTKSQRNGWALRLTLIRSPQRLSRLLLVLALAYLLLVMIGLHAIEQCRSGRWCSSNRPGECSLFLVGRFMQDLPLPPLIRLAAQLRRELTGGNWG